MKVYYNTGKTIQSSLSSTYRQRFCGCLFKKWGLNPGIGYTVNTNISFNRIPTPDRIDFIFYKVPRTMQVVNKDTHIIGPKFRGYLRIVIEILTIFLMIMMIV